MHTKVSAILIIFSLLLVSCNLPTSSGAAPVDNPSVDVVGTSVELTVMARQGSQSEVVFTPTLAFTDTPLPLPTATIPPTACVPMVTSTTTANVRSGPDTVYDVVGYLPQGGTAVVAGRNDINTWWYIEFPSGVGGHAWVAGSVVTTACLPAVIPVVAAPPVPTAVPATATNTVPAPIASVDLVASGMMVHPNPATKGSPVSVRVKVSNQGTIASGAFSVQWWATWALVGCNWVVPSLAPGASTNLDCTYTYGGTSSYTIKLVVDSGNMVSETNEGNNSREAILVVKSP